MYRGGKKREGELKTSSVKTIFTNLKTFKI